MVSSRLYLDIRRPDKNGRGALRVVITKNGTTAMMSLGIKLLPEQWNGREVVNHPEMKLLNSAIRIKVGNIEKALLTLSVDGRFAGKKAAEVLSLIEEELDPDKALLKKEAKVRKEIQAKGVAAVFNDKIEGLTNEGTKQLYQDTLNKIKNYCKECNIDFENLSFDDIDCSFLYSFEQFCLRTQKQNTASRHLRDLRAVFKKAIKENKTKNYPFLDFKIKEEETKDKSFPVEKLRELFSHKCESECEQEAVDMFKLMFCFIGINDVDLANLKEEKNGRIEYIRKKTGKLVSVKIEPEAREILEKYKGKEYLLNILERNPNYKTYFNNMGKTLKKIGLVRVPGKKSVGKPILPGVCPGSARTSWATIAEYDDIVDHAVVDSGLAHSKKKDVTSKYYSRINWRKKVDVANRKVLDWVFYGKRKID